MAWIAVAFLLGALIARQFSPPTDRWPPYASVYAATAPSVVTLLIDGETPRVGAGFAVTPTHVVTARHLVEGIDTLVVSDIDGRTWDAHVLGSDTRDDLALLEVPDARFAPVTLGSAANLAVGDPVLAIGNPYGMGHSVSTGVVGGSNRRVVGADGVAIGPDQGFLQLSIPLNPGNSGGPVFDQNGRAVAILSGTHAQGQAIAFAVPIEALEAVLPRLSQGERLSRAFIGARTEVAANGVVVAAVTAGGPADRAGIRTGDRIVSLGDAPIMTSDELYARLDQLSAGQRVPVVVERDGKPETTEVELADWALHPIVVAGMTLRPVPGTGGEVVAVRPRSRAERAGIRLGDMVRAVGGIPVQAPADVQQAITMGRGPIEVLREGSTITVAWPEPG